MNKVSQIKVKIHSVLLVEGEQRKQRDFTMLNVVAVLVAVLCLFLPFLVRLPRGFGWAFQYLWSDGQSLGNAIGSHFFFGIFACLPSVVTAGAVWLSRPRWYLPGVFACAVAFYCLAYWHHDNDLDVDAQAALSLIFIPIYTAALAFFAGVIGLVIQVVMRVIVARKHRH